MDGNEKQINSWGKKVGKCGNFQKMLEDVQFFLENVGIFEFLSFFFFL